jgi:hypothetical protein
MYFDDLPKGFTFETGTRTLGEDEILAFARQWDPQDFHTDPEAAKASPYGGLIASGFHALGPSGPTRRHAAGDGRGNQFHAIAIAARSRPHRVQAHGAEPERRGCDDLSLHCDPGPAALIAGRA